ncbi:hypothetical protein CABS01_13874 [Colletotrichum abscissum]|uniref:Uncharacterized protein n=1 Tax=Colletotrichum abscissum TaxID=1671311 RepID=A0A9P9X1J8_9PEZI|nr:uncharacterized protein CABS01_13874 [Colletotrichum abscissum]KAI3531386.1 hypothetical protein CABS02_14179 [Colletotrichum abscissum]KAK1484451.1 hypothetical protein CABS01_13874 [Colletotrichum abscissum]
MTAPGLHILYVPSLQAVFLTSRSLAGGRGLALQDHYRALPFPPRSLEAFPGLNLGAGGGSYIIPTEEVRQGLARISQCLGKPAFSPLASFLVLSLPLSLLFEASPSTIPVVGCKALELDPECRERHGLVKSPQQPQKKGISLDVSKIVQDTLQAPKETVRANHRLVIMKAPNFTSMIDMEAAEQRGSITGQEILFSYFNHVGCNKTG